MEAAARNKAVKDLMTSSIKDAAAIPVDERPDPPALDAEAAGLLMDLWAGPAAREAAYVLLAYCLVEGRVLNLIDANGGDLKTDVPRLSGDRAVSEHLSKRVLTPLGVPSTQGAFQSSTYRGGYLAGQADNPSLARFVRWTAAPGRALAELQALFDNLTAAFAADSFIVPHLPELNRRAFTFAAFGEVITRLFKVPSQGAYEQYTLAALLAEYLDGFDTKLKVVTKPIFESDKAGGTAGDVDVRAGQNVEAAYEISSANWKLKLAQAVDALTARDELDQITILANQPPKSGSEILEALTALDLAPGVVPRELDVAVLGIWAECQSLAAHLNRKQREAATDRLYKYLLRYCRTRPDLITSLLQILGDLGLIDEAAVSDVVATADP